MLQQKEAHASFCFSKRSMRTSGFEKQLLLFVPTPPNPMFARLLRIFLFLCLALLCAAQLQAAVPSANTVITNTASAAFVDAATGLSVRLNSNTVETRVTALEALSLTADQALQIATGSSFTISHTLFNTGNTLSNYGVSANAVAGGGFTPINLQVVQDINGNGRADPGEPVIGAGGLIALQSGASVALLITGQIPGSASAGAAAQVQITAVSQLQGARATNTDTLNLTNGAALQVVLAASASASVPGSTLGYTVTTVNNGNVAAAPAVVSVNGISTNLFILRVAIPTNTALAAAQPSSNVSSQTLYHLAGSPADSYVTAIPASATADAVAWSLGSLVPGGSLQGRFSVVVGANAGGNLSNTAYADWTDSGVVSTTASNTVLVSLPDRAASISFYGSSTYSALSSQGKPGQPLFVQVDAAVCNSNPTLVSTVPVKLTSLLTGDVETFTATETGPNTGIFRILPDVPTANGALKVVTAGDGVLEVLRNDTVTATITSCGGLTVSALTKLLIDPSGVVYDSKSNQPVAGATVQLIDVTGAGNGGNAGGPASVLLADASGPAPNSVVTGADGSFAFPLVAPSTYRLIVTPPIGFVFPSALPPALQPAGRNIDLGGSYGGTFVIGGASSAPVQLDLPLDVGGNGGIFIQKTANKTTVEIGDFIDYSIRVNNVTKAILPAAVLNDTLPAGFAYVRGSARLSGASVADPAGSSGSNLQFEMGSIAAAAQPVLTYRVRVGAGSHAGTGVNTAQVISGTAQSNRSSVRVRITGGVFSDKAYIIGKVFADCSRDGVQDASESGIPGVRIYLEDGTYAVTDEEGKYSFYGLAPRTHVAKVDATTLPIGASLGVLANRNGLDAGSRFVDLQNGELQKADFAALGCAPALQEQIAARRKALASPSEIVQAAASLLAANSTTPADARTLPAAGAMGLPGALQSKAGDGMQTPLSAGAMAVAPTVGILGAVGDAGGSYAPNAQGKAQPLVNSISPLKPTTSPTDIGPSATDATASTLNRQPLEDVLPQLDASVGFVGLADGQVMTSDQTWVRVKGPLGAVFVLTVNEQSIPANQVGKKASLEKNGTSAWEYIGVNLKPGRNILAVQVLDPFGIARGKAQLTLIAPGALSKMLISAPGEAVADAATALAVTVALQDADGTPVAARTQVTLDASLGQWQTTDVDTHQPGIQVFIEGGQGRFLLLPPAQPGKAEIRVAVGTVKTAATIDFMPNLRPMIAAGVVEGVINLRKLGSALQAAGGTDAFERQIQSASHSFNDGKGNVAARTALFLKGKVLGSSLLTLAYDSDKPLDTSLFRDIQPQQFYPVYGDSSARGFDAQSTGKLYLLLQNGNNYALLGDYSTQTDNPARLLTQYSRALNGAKSRWAEGPVTVDAFASRTSSTQLVQEFRADGTSGPFRLNLNGVVNSQQVDIITRSRSQASVIVSDTALSPFTDYEIEPFSGRLLLKSPVASVDVNLNPVYIRVSYSVDEGGAKHSVGGVDARVDVGAGITLGASAMRDADPVNSQSLEGLNATLRLTEKTVATAELARSSTDAQGSGSGQRFEIKHEEGALQARAWGARTSEGFYNPSSLQSAGQSEYGAKIGYTVDESSRIVAEALRTTNSTTGAAQTGVELKLERSLAGNIKVEAGVRYSSANAVAALSAPAPAGTLITTLPSTAALAAASTEETDVTSARVKVTVPVPGLPQADVFGLAEYAIDGSGGREVGVGGNYAIGPGSRAYVRHDFINSLNSPYTLNTQVSQYTTVAGINTEVTDSTQVFNEYRLGDSIDGRTAEASLGLRQQFRLDNGVGLSASFQRIKPMAGPARDDSTAITLGADYVAAATWKASGQVQWQESTTSRSWLLTGAVASKLDESWTLLNRGLYNRQISVGAGSGERTLVNAQSGLAFRPVDSDVWNGLARIEFKRDTDSTLGEGLARDQSGLILSTHLNVQPSKSWLISGRYAAKWAKDQSNGLNSRSFTQLIGGRSTWDLTERWDASLQAYRLWGNGAAEAAVGVEVGYLAYKNLWLSVGYNITGFRAADLGGDAYTQRGLYVRLRFKFDETLLDTSRAVSANAGDTATLAAKTAP